MEKIKRIEFLKKISFLLLAALVLPKFIFGARIIQGAEEESFVFDDHAIIDLHCHPSLKMYMENKKFWKRHLFRSPGENLLHMQEDVHEFSYGNVRALVATHYLPEGGIAEEWGTLKSVLPAIKKIAFATTDKIEHEDYSNISQISMMMDILENQMHAANEKLIEKKKPLRFIVVRDYYEFIDMLSTQDHLTNNIPVVHAIEGAHALGRNLVQSKQKLKEKQKLTKSLGQKMTMEAVSNFAVLAGEGKMDPDQNHHEKLYVLNLELLHKRGVCMMTLSHFFANDLSYPVEGISTALKRLVGMDWIYKDDAEHNKHLTDVGKKVVERMFIIGMIVDLTHSTPNVRKDVFEIRNRVNEKRMQMGKVPRPVIFSHAGSVDVFEKHDNNTNSSYKFYNVSKTEVKQICKYDGLIGIIPENFWLLGSNLKPEIDGKVDFDHRSGIPYIIETMKDLNSKTTGDQDFDHIAIGTDFDGLATNPKDLYLNRQLSDLISAMAKDPVLSINDRIAKITYKNALRVMQNGWGEGPVKPAERDRYVD